MMTPSLPIGPQECSLPLVLVVSALESIGRSNHVRNRKIRSWRQNAARNSLSCEHSSILDDLLRPKEEENESHFAYSSIDKIFSLRGGSTSVFPNHTQQHHHLLAFASNLPTHSHHYHDIPLHHTIPLYETMIASPLPPEDAEKLKQAAHKGVVAEELSSSNTANDLLTVTESVSLSEATQSRRRRFRWLRLGRKDRRQAAREFDSSTLDSAQGTSASLQKQHQVEETPLRFLRAAKGDPILARQRYLNTLKWRKQYDMDTILQEPSPQFEFIKQHYPHYFHLRGRNNEPVYFEMPAKTNLKALRDGGVTLPLLLRHYAMVTEFTWQYVEPSDEQQSIYVLDLDGIRITDFVGECVEFVRKACAFCNAHYPERSGCILVVNVPSYFKLIWRVVRKFADKKTLAKVRIVRGKEEILQALLEFIPMENIPPQYGGTSMPLGDAPEEQLLWDLMRHNNQVSETGTDKCGGIEGGCPFCTFEPVRKY